MIVGSAMAHEQRSTIPSLALPNVPDVSTLDANVNQNMLTPPRNRGEIGRRRAEGGGVSVVIAEGRESRQSKPPADKAETPTALCGFAQTERICKEETG